MKREMFGTILPGGIAVILMGILSSGAVHGDTKRPLQPPAAAPLAALTPDQLDAYSAGRNAYKRQFTPEEGLGPVFNIPTCSGCHNNPIGGAGGVTVELFGFLDPNTGEFDPLRNLGGPVKQASAIPGCSVETVPSAANVHTVRRTLGSMGYGLIEAIPDEAIEANADPDDLDGDGVRGFVHWVHALEDASGPARAGRFGWKAQLPTVMSFSVDAAHNEIGLTSPLLMDDNAANQTPGTGDCDTVAEPEVSDLESSSYLREVEAFQRYMAPPPQSPRSGMTGEVIFNAIGCNVCHVRSFTTSTDLGIEPALRGVEIQPYSDFLLHSMPDVPDGIPTGDAGPDDIRTPTLWGVRNRRKLLHDASIQVTSVRPFGVAVVDVIAAHGPLGEAAGSANAFAQLPQVDQLLLIDFLRSLGRDDFDIDDDGNVDADDFALAVECMGVTITPDDDCAVADLDGDGSVDAGDIETLQSLLGGEIVDCNNNGIVDTADIASGFSSDVNGNGIPEECEDLPNQCGIEVHRFLGGGGAIPDLGPDPAKGGGPFLSDITIAEAGDVVGVRVTLDDLIHPWADTLRIELRHTDVDGTVRFAPVSFECGIDWDFIGDYEFRDDGTRTICNTVEVDENGVLVIPEGIYFPNAGSGQRVQFSSFFGGFPSGGTWELSVWDRNDDGFAGTLGGWRLDLITESTADCNGNSIADDCEIDSDGDGVIDDCDGCPNDPDKTEPGDCGCGGADTDGDGDGAS
ncbi:hypothetical protein OAG01_01670, partial [bacterium]|nr:hypothetical protein [bacterium]